MPSRDLTTTRSQVFGDVEKGTECRICGRNVTDGRSKFCSDYCSNLATAVMNMLNWSSVRRQILDRDDYTCQECGFRKEWLRKGNAHIRDIIDSKLPKRPETPGMAAIGEEWDDDDWSEYFDRMNEWREQRDELRDRYGDPTTIEIRLEVDHITPVANGGHPFDPANLQTLCTECHQEKTSRQASETHGTPSASELNESLFKYVSNGGET